MRQTFSPFILFLSACFFLAGRAFSQPPSGETFDRIVLKDMTVIKASLVKEVGDSLAYFEFNDPDFVKHMIGRDQVFKWVKAAGQSGAPEATSAKPLFPEPLKPQSAAPGVDADGTPIVDYQIVLARLDSIERSKQGLAPLPLLPAATALPVIAPVAAPNPSQADISDSVPQDLTRVRLDPPTGTQGVKLVPRSGMTAININPSISSLGVGFRHWAPTGFGLGVTAEVLWGITSGFHVNGEFMKALNKEGRVRWYLFPAIGYRWISYNIPEMDIGSVTIPSSETDLSFANYCIGLGAEWRMGINRNHSLSVELALQGGKAEYETRMESYSISPYLPPVPAKTFKDTLSLSPVFFGVSYAYYF